jgi:LPS O-antigen subunit length determinant protein (WzzB/FepE family)
MENNKDIILYEKFQSVLKNWWIVAAMMIIGSLVGWGGSQLRDPIYQSEAAIAVTIDYSRIGRLFDTEINRLIKSVGNIIESDEVLNQIKLSSELNNHFIEANKSLERQDNIWILRVRSNDPEAAKEIAQAWQSTAIEILESAASQAEKAAFFQQYLDSYATCLESAVVIAPVQPLCEQLDSADLENKIDEAIVIIQTARKQSRGLMPYVNISVVDSFGKASWPVNNDPGMLLISGAVIGFIIGVVLSSNSIGFLRNAKK